MHAYVLVCVFEIARGLSFSEIFRTSPNLALKNGF